MHCRSIRACVCAKVIFGINFTTAEGRELLGPCRNSGMMQWCEASVPHAGGPDTPDAPQNAAQIYVALCAMQAAVAVPHIVLPVEVS